LRARAPRIGRGGARAVLALLLAAAAGCYRAEEGPAARTAPPPSVVLVTLDTTRADAVAPEAAAADTPNLARLAAGGARFAQAYATAPETLPAHASLLTGLYPAAHGVHENGRTLDERHPLLAAELQRAGYATAAFVSAYVLDRRFGLARGFDRYDDELGAGREERPAAETTDRALAWLREAGDGPVFLWVHYYDAHAPYTPPEPFASRFAGEPYRGEVASVDRELGRLLDAFEREREPARRPASGGRRIVVVGDHGEALGEHGEAQHGSLLYQGVMRVPLVLAGDGVAPATVSAPVSARRVFDTVLGWAGRPGGASLLDPASAEAVVLGEAMKPHLAWGWRPQVMAIEGRLKAIRSGETEVYDVLADPAERDDLAGRVSLGRAAREALRGYPMPALPAADAGLDEETRRRLASLGYAASTGTAPRRRDAPSPRRMTHLLADLERGSGLFARGEYAAAAPVFERIVAADPENPMAAVTLAVAHSMQGHDEEAERWFRRAAGIAPGSLDLRHYEAMHHCKTGDLERATPLLESVVAQDPWRLPTLECLVRVRERQGRRAEAADLLERVVAMKDAPAGELLRLGELRMAGGETAAAIAALERARQLQRERFTAHLELGVLYVAARRLPEARDSLDRVPPSSPGFAMALFKRAQVSVLLQEPERRARVQAARDHADDTTRELIARERLFRGLL
jgi:arylsulfatase A-like enzyme/Tfp pilus assembly protein PilF